MAKNMYCFFCGNRTAKDSSLVNYSVPLCNECKNSKFADFYLKKKRAVYGSSYEINPPIRTITEETCEFCSKKYLTDSIFENFGFSKKVCTDCLQQFEINISLSNKYIKPIWRKRTYSVLL